MGVIGGGRRIDGDLLRQLASDPEELAWYVQGWVRERYQPGFIGRLLGRKAEPAPKPRAEWKPPPQDETLYLDKAWHAIHFLLTGSGTTTDGPLAFLLGGQAIWAVHDEMRLHFADDVAAIASALEPFDREALAARFDWPAMVAQGLYSMPDAPDEDFKEYVLDFAVELLGFVKVAAANRQGLVIQIG